MSSLSMALESRLARAAALTGRLAQRGNRSAASGRAVSGLDFLARGLLHVWRNRRYLTAVKLLNMAAVNLQFRLKTQRVIGRPYRMKIESTNICNTRCQLCPTGLGLRGRAKGIMSDEGFRGLIDQLKRYLYVLDLSMWGDPLIAPDIYRMIRYAHHAGIWTYVSSNLHGFKPEKGQAEALVHSGLDMLTCSLHGASQSTYETYQPGKQFDAAVQKIRQIIEVRDRLGSPTPVVQLNFIVTRHNEHERQAFVELAQRLGCKAVFSIASMNVRFLGQDQQLADLGLSGEQLTQKTRAHLQHWLPGDPKCVLEAYQRMLEGRFNAADWNGRKMMNCPWPWQSSVINWDGAVSICCGSFDGREDMGNVFRTPFDQIWNSRAYRLARRSFTRKLPDDQAQQTACASCPGFMV